MKHVKHLLSTMAVLLCSITASAVTVQIDGIWYNLVAKVKQAEVTCSTDGAKYSAVVTIPATVSYNDVEYNVVSIGNIAFEGCSNLTSITIPEGVTTIGYGAFDNCSSLTAITIPEGVTSIGGYAFQSCTAMTSISIPRSLTSIEPGAFHNCSRLSEVHINDVASWCNIDFKGDDWILPGAANPLRSANLYLNGNLVTELTVPNSVTIIKPYAFEGCSSLTAITIPESVTSIGSHAFEYCSNLTSITIPENSQLTSIGSSAFYDCSSLTAITIPEGVTSIGSSAFSRCSSLTAITIPESVTSIEWYTFYNCSSLTAITIPENSQLTSIGDGAFSDCSSLTTITIPEGVESIGSNAFSGCSGLTTIVLPKSVRNIYHEAFTNCTELLDVYCHAETVPVTEANAFNGSYIEYATLHVPIIAFANYKATAPWSSFGKFETTSVAVANITLNQSSITLIEGENTSLSIDITPDDATDKTVLWSSSDESVATVENGVVTAIAPGTATITVTANDGSGVSATCVITVEKKVVTSITLSQSEATITEGETLTLTASVSPSDVTDKTVKWNSSTPAVATVKDGVVKAKAVGTAIITARAGDKVAICVVTVEKKVVDVSGITLSQSEATINEGETLTLTASVSPSDATDKTIAWSSSNPNVATVEDGVVTALTVGTATITAKVDDKEAICVVTVIDASDVDSVLADEANVAIYDLSGRRVVHPTKGVYIVNGRKVIVND